MSVQWHYTKDGQQSGPVSSEELKALAASGELAPTDMIWKEGMAKWMPASAIKGLFAPVAVAPLDVAPVAVAPARAPRMPQRMAPPQPAAIPETSDAEQWQPAQEPPISESRPVTIDISGLLKAPPLAWALRGVLLLLFICMMLPWFSASVEEDSRLGDLIKSQSAEMKLNQSKTFSMFGSPYNGSVALGIFISLLSVGAIAVSILDRTVPFAEMIVAAAVVLALILLVCAMLFVGPSSDDVKLASRIGLKLGLTWGAWLALVFGLAAVTLTGLVYQKALLRIRFKTNATAEPA